jgi:DNA-binding MurR/RpiR family transcriptional regulator
LAHPSIAKREDFPVAQPALDRIKAGFDALPRGLQRAARWVADNPADVCVLSMREQARRADVVPPTFSRLARALGFSSYAALRSDFRVHLRWGAGDFSARAERMQTGRRATARSLGVLGELQEQDVASLPLLNESARFQRVARLLLKARTTGFLGFRSCHSVALHAHYLYSMLMGRGVLLQDAYGTLNETIAALAPESALVAVGLSPYSRQTVDAVRRAAARGVTVIALTDSELSPLARSAGERLLFEAASSSFFHSLVAAHALVERVMAEVALKGGKPVVQRLREREALLRETGAYWDGTQ